MMEYTEFKKEVEDRFMDFMPEEMRDMEMNVLRVDKVNVTLDGINIKSGEGSAQILPTIYINDMYKHYLECGDLDGVLRTSARAMLEAAADRNSIAPDAAGIKDHVVFQLINTQMNQHLLSGIPSRPFLDLSVIYRWTAWADDDGVGSAVIDNQTAGRLGLAEEELFRLAQKNTKRIFPPRVRPLNDIFREAFMKEGMSGELEDTADTGLGNAIWIISNNKGINGAASVLYEDELYRLAGKLGSDLYILPSSLHEVLAVPVDMGEPEELAWMVEEVNREQVDITEQLSDRVYRYDRNLRKLELAIDTPYKRLQWERKKEGYNL